MGISVILAVAVCGTGVLEPPLTAPPSSSGKATPPPTAPPATSGKATAPDRSSVRQLAGEVSDARALRHMRALQEIADKHGGNRAIGTSGYDASVKYVVGVLRGAGFKVSTPTYEVSGGDDWVAPGTGRNVIAQTRTGNPGRVVMIGAHLDLVPEGPAIVDNGSGVAALLEIATRLGVEPSVQNMVRFAFFDNEENGAVGSTAYVESLSAADRQKIKLYLNVDMVASPNGGYFVQGGKGNDPEEAGPTGSATIGRVFAAQLAKAGVTSRRSSSLSGTTSRRVHRGGHRGRRREVGGRCRAHTLCPYCGR
jgi:aminopeptidase S